MLPEFLLYWNHVLISNLYRLCNFISLINEKEKHELCVWIPNLTAGSPYPLSSCWYCECSPNVSLLCPPHIHPLPSTREPSFTLSRFTVLPEVDAPLDMSPQVCKGQLWGKVCKAACSERNFSLPSLSQGSTEFSSSWCFGRHPTPHLLCEPHPTFLSSSLIISPFPPPHTDLVLIDLWPGMCTRESIKRLIDCSWVEQLSPLLHKSAASNILHAQTQPIWKPPISSYQSGLGLGSGHSGIQHLLEWSPDTLPRQHWFGPFSLALLHQTGTSPVVSLFLCEQAPSQKGFPDGLVSSSTHLAAFRLKDAGSAQSWFTKSDSVQCSIYTGSLQTVPAGFGTVFPFWFSWLLFLLPMKVEWAQGPEGIHACISFGLG